LLNASSQVNSRAGVAVNKVQASCIGRYNQTDGYASQQAKQLIVSEQASKQAEGWQADNSSP